MHLSSLPARSVTPRISRSSRAKQQISIDVTQSYYQLILDMQIVDIDQKNLEADQARASLLDEEAEVGSATLADSARQRAQVAQDQSLVIASQVKLHDDELSLLQKLRLDPKLTYDFAPAEMNVPPGELALGEKDLIETALTSRMDLKASDSTSKSADWDIEAARSDYFPKLNLGFGLNSIGDYVYSQSVNGANSLSAPQPGLFSQMGAQIAYSMQLTLSWNLFARGTTRLNVSRARIAEDNSEIDLARQAHRDSNRDPAGIRRLRLRGESARGRHRRLSGREKGIRHHPRPVQGRRVELG